jgi:hypothetical protein
MQDGLLEGVAREYHLLVAYMVAGLDTLGAVLRYL